jgi:Domain of unknown function (DUF4160)
MTALREKLNEMLTALGIEEATAIRVMFENGDTVLVESQDDAALYRTDPIRSAKIIQYAEASAPVQRLNNVVTLGICLKKRHLKPHVHADYGGERHAASFSIETGERITPKWLPQKYRRYDTDVKSYLLTHKHKLLAIWRGIRLGKDARPLIEELQDDALREAAGANPQREALTNDQF